MRKVLETALGIALIGTLAQANVYEDGEDGQIDGWRALGNGNISNIVDNGNRVIQLSGEKRNEFYILGGTNKISDKPYKWDAREGTTLSWRMKFEKKPEIYVPIRTANQSDKIRYIKYVSSSDRDESGWNRSGSVLTIKVSQKFEGDNWVTLKRDLEQDLRAYVHPNDPTQNSLIAINGFMVLGSGLIDDVEIIGGEVPHEELTVSLPLEPANCQGEIIKSGLDLNDNGILEEDEVVSTTENYTEGTPVTRMALDMMILNGEDVTQVNTCKITDMSNLFMFNVGFNQDISGWNTGSVTNMEGMFFSASSFNQPIGAWDVSNVTNMGLMFSSASGFNQPIGEWDVSNVESMELMFMGASLFDQPIGEWDVSNVNSMAFMFSSSAFNHSIGAWDVSSVNDMRWMFYDAQLFNQPLGEWDVSNVEDMNWMFKDAKAFNQDISEWSVDNVTSHDDFAVGSILQDDYNPFYVAPAPTEDVNLTNGLVAHFIFDGSASDGDADLDATYMDDIVAQATSEEGVTEYIDASEVDGVVPNALAEVTISTWIELPDDVNVVGQLLEGQTSLGEIDLDESLASMIVGKWINITLIFDGNSLKQKLYLNGILLKESSSAEEITLETGFAMGSSLEQSLQNINGRMYDLRVYNRALNESEITALYQQGR